MMKIEKSNLTFLLIFLTLLAIMPLVLAENEKCFGSTDGISKCGIDSDLISNGELENDFNENVSDWDITTEKIKNWFTFNQEKKAERELKIAKMYLVRARILEKNNNTQAMEKALEAHNRILEKLQNRIENINGASDEKGVKNNIDKLVGLERAIEVHELRIEKLQSLLENQNLSEEKQAIIENKIAKAQNVTSNLLEKKEAKQEKLKTKLMALGNLSESEAEDIIENITEEREQIREQNQEENQESNQEENQENNCDGSGKGKNANSGTCPLED